MVEFNIYLKKKFKILISSLLLIKYKKPKLYLNYDWLSIDKNCWRLIIKLINGTNNKSKKVTTLHNISLKWFKNKLKQLYFLKL